MLCHSTRLVCLVWVAFVAGCAPTAGTLRVADLRTRVSDLQQRLQVEKRRVEDLNNRVFLLQDRLDSQRAVKQPGVVASRSAVSKARPVAAARAVSRRAPAPRTRRAAPVDTAAERARRRARRRLPVVKLRRHARRSRRFRRARRSRRLAARKGPPKSIVLRLTGTPNAPRTSGSRRRAIQSLGPIPKVHGRLAYAPIPGGTTPAPAALAGSAESDYRAARGLFMKKKYAAAGTAFSRFVRTHPRHGYADNAQYWLAECFYRRGQVAKAAWVLRKLLKRYPSGNKAPSALLKLAVCERRLGRKAKARKILGQVLQLYKGTPEAARAAKHLKRGR